MNVNAQEGTSNIKFSIKPRLCVLTEGETLCEDLLEVSWASDEPRSLCLFRSDKNLPIRCWENETAGTHSFALAIANNVQFDLREVNQNLPLVSREFEVVQSTDKYRRKRRNPWSFF